MAKAKAKDDDIDSYDDDQPKAKVSALTMVLCLLNVVAAGAFVYFLLMDLEKRQAWSYAVFLHDVYILGLPLKEEEELLTASRQVAPRAVLRPDQILSAHQGRKGPDRGPFQAVNEQLPARILPSHLNEEILKDIFGSLKSPVATQEEEVDRIKSSIFMDIAKAAKELADAEKTDAEKQQRLEKVLLPLACNTYQVRALDKHIRAAKDLDKELTDALRRRMLVDILQPLEMNRPGDVESLYLEKVGDLAKTKIEDLEDQLKKRLDGVTSNKYNAVVFHGKDWDQKDRETIEKRRAIAYLLFTIAHVNKPDGTPLDPKGPDRAQVVSGVYEFAVAAAAYTQALLTLEARVLTFIQGDREGNLAEKDTKIERTPGFIDRYPVVVQNLREIVGQIDQAQKRVLDLKDQSQKAQKNYEDRVEHLKEISTKLVNERSRTEKLVVQLRLMQVSLFRAQVELADAAETNFELEKAIRKGEGFKTGGKTP